MLTDTHLISTSNPVSPDEPQPVMEIGETSEQPSQVAPTSDTQVVAIQPPPLGDAGDMEFEPGTTSTERKKRNQRKIKRLNTRNEYLKTP